MKELYSRDADIFQTLVIDATKISPFTVPPAVKRNSDSGYPLGYIGSGLTKTGPYDVNTTDASVRRNFGACEFVCLYPQGQKAVQEHLARLASYLSAGYKTTGYGDTDCPPFKEIFRLTNVNFPTEADFLAYDLEELTEIEHNLSTLRQQVEGRGNRFFALVAVESHKSVALPASRYTTLKKLLNSLSIPSQFLAEFQSETQELGVLPQVSHGGKMGWTVWNVALQIYAKLGGVPWIVFQDPSNHPHVDLTIGLRFALTEEAGTFCLGVATVMDRFGRLIGIVPIEGLATEKAWGQTRGMSLSSDAARRLITSALDNALLDPRTQQTLRDRSQVSVVLHKLGPTPFYDLEMAGIRAALNNKLPNKEVRLAFVPIVEHPALAAFGPPSAGRVINEGQALRLAPDSALVYTMGLRQFTEPLALKLQNHGQQDCAFSTIEQACAHVRSLCGLHWQMTSSGRLRLPANLHFAAEIAKAFSKGLQPAADSPLWKTPWYL